MDPFTLAGGPSGTALLHNEPHQGALEPWSGDRKPLPQRWRVERPAEVAVRPMTPPSLPRRRKDDFPVRLHVHHRQALGQCFVQTVSTLLRAFDTKVTIDCLVLRIPRWQRIGWLREVGCEDCRAEQGGGEQLLFVDEFHQCVFQPSMIARSQMRTFTIRLMSSSNEMRVSSSGTTGSSVTTIN